MKLILKSILLLVFSIPIIVFGGPYDADFDLFDQANQHYSKGNFNEAVEAYEELSKSNESAIVFYNLGNAYFKNDQNTMAIYYYEKALKLKPDFEDALFNLKMANANTIDKIEEAPETVISKTWKGIILSKTSDTWATYYVSLLFICTLLFIIYLFGQQLLIKKSSFFAGLFFLLMALFSWLMASQNIGIKENSVSAIIFEPTVDITSEPNLTSKKLFTLHEGTKVDVSESTSEYSKIKLSNGNVGWLKTSAIKAI